MSEETATCTICRQPLGENGRCQHCDEETRVWTIQDWRPLLTLSLLIALGFSFTRLVVGIFEEKQNTLAGKYYVTGTRAMEAQHPAEAVKAFETALVYSHNNFQYRLKLTDALLASGATSEAKAQLLAFLDDRPGDAQVNLKLARLAAQRKQVDEALGYYQNAIEGVWPEHSDPVPQKIGARLEAAQYLIDLGRKDEAEGVLLAVEAVLPVASPDQQKLGELFLRNGDAGQALTIFEAEVQQLEAERRAGFIGNPLEKPLGLTTVGGEASASDRYRSALLGAGKASLAAGSYATARRYLEEMKPESEESHSLLEQLQRMEALDPFAKSATGKIRTDRTMAAFRIALERLARCGVPFAEAMTGASKAGTSNAGTSKASVAGATVDDTAQWSGFARWAGQLSPTMNERKLRGRDDVIESTMRFAFQAEMAAQKGCGIPNLNDEALLLLARERMGANR